MRRLGLNRPRDLIPSLSRRRAARCWPDQRKCPRKLSVRVYRGLGQSAAPQSSCPGSSWKGHTCRAPPRACSVSKATSPSVKCQCNRGCGRAVSVVLPYWGPPRSDDPVGNSAVTGALVSAQERDDNTRSSPDWKA